MLAVMVAGRVRLLLGVIVVMLEEMMVEVGMLLLNPHVPKVPVLADELVHSPVELLYPRALRLDEALLVLDNGGKLPQVQNRLHRVFQKAGAHHRRLKTETGRGVNKDGPTADELTLGAQRRREMGPVMWNVLLGAFSWVLLG